MSQHRIAAINVHLVKIPAKAVHSHGSGDVAGIHSVQLEITTDSGVTGWGEASPWAVFTGTVEANAAALHVHLRPHLLGKDPLQVEAIMSLADKVILGHFEAKAALETALLDIAGRISGLSISELVGGRHRETIPMSFSIANPDFEHNMRDAEQLFAEGVRIFKLKTGFADHRFDVMRLERLRARFGDAVSLRVDYNQGLDAYDAIRRLRDIEAFKPDFIEQPVKMHEREALAAITRALDTPVMADESVFDVKQAVRAAAERIADIFSLKIMKSGGIRRALEVAAIARAVGIEVYGGCMFETSIAHAAGAHLMAAVPDLKLGCEFYMTSYYASADIGATAFVVKNGMVHVPNGPGLGIAPDRDKLAHYTLQVLR
jgi:muconate cycloisomerase